MHIEKQGIAGNLLALIESAGNRLPHPTTLFLLLAVLMLPLSALFAWLGYSATHPVSGETLQVTNLLSPLGIQRILEKTVTNFTQFAPVGTVLIAMLGLGIAEKSGLLGCLLKLLVTRTPQRLITPCIVFTGILSSLAADAGYVILIPLAGALFASAKRHPIAGMAAAFAGVSGGYSANLMIGPLDVMLAGISTEAIRLVEPDISVSPFANYYFIIASTLLITVLGTWITDAVIMPRLPSWQENAPSHQDTQLNYHERRALSVTCLVFLVLLALIAWMTLPADGWLRDPVTGSLAQSPATRGIVSLIAIVFGVLGLAYGLAFRSFRSDRQIIASMEDTFASMAGYLVLMFFAAQFVSYFAWSNLGVITAIKGSSFLNTLALPTVLVMVGFVLMAGLINLLIGSASAKWAVMAPVFVPMFWLTGIDPALVQAAYRIGDSSTNIITPLMPYFGVVVAFMQRYEKDIGLGTIMALMIPYSVTFLIGWIGLLAVWLLAGFSLGPAW